MHNRAKEMACWAMDKAKMHGYDNLTSQDWDDLKDCMEAAKCAVCIDKDYRIIEAMGEAEKEERMGYNSHRYVSGRYAPVGRGHYSGYSHMPYLEEDDYLMDYIQDPVAFSKRMGYPVKNGTGTTPYNNSKYGEAYDGWEHARRHYTETHDNASKEDMEKYTKEHMHRAIDSMLKMYKDAEPDLKLQMKTEVEKLMGQM